ncbi:Calmodulin [Dictyocoela muelleri]|nr:Calmodulin [Dictyocoela muelleri]
MDVLYKIFLRINKSGTGYITIEELIIYFSDLKFNLTEKDEEFIFNKFGMRGLSFQDFFNIWSSYDFSTAMEDNVKETFSVFDIDSDGLISLDDLKKVMRHLGIKRSDGEIEIMIRMADKDGDGYVSFEEFKEVLYR